MTWFMMTNAQIRRRRQAMNLSFPARLWRADHGAATAEYVILISAIAILLIAAETAMHDSLAGLYEQITDALAAALGGG